MIENADAHQTNRSPASVDVFTHLVRQHADMVYSSARRQVNDPALADDITQAVFLLLWQKLPKVRQEFLPGWLLKATWFASRRTLTMRARRRVHERKAAIMRSECSAESPDEIWAEIAPRVDEAIQKLPDADRAALALRYMQNHPLREVGHSLGISEEAARKRVDRALAKLRKMLGVSAGAPLSAAIVAHALTPAPAILLQTLLTIPSAAISASVVALSQSILKALTLAKAKLVAILGIGVVAATSIAIAAGQLALPAEVTPATRPAVAVASPSPSSPATAPASVALFIYAAGLEAPVANDLKKIGTVVQSKDNYQLLLADAETVRKLLLRDYLAGNVIVPEHITRTNTPANISQDVKRMESWYWMSSVYDRAKWNLVQQFFFSRESSAVLDQGQLRLLGDLRIGRLTASDDKWRGSGEKTITGVFPLTVTIPPNQVALALHNLGQVGNAERFSLCALCPIPATPAESAVLSDASTEVYLRLGPAGCLQCVQYAASRRPATTQPNAKWTRTLSDGTTVRLVAIGMPNRWPLLMWDPDGNPVDRRGQWPVASPAVTSPQFVYEVVSPHPTGNSDSPIILADGSRRFRLEENTVWGGLSYSYKTSQLLKFSIRMGVGPWQGAGRLKPDAVLSVPGLKVRTTSPKSFAPNMDEITYTLLEPTDKAFTFTGISKNGERLFKSWCDTLIGNPGNQEIRLDWGKRPHIAHIFKGDAIDFQAELLYRDATIVSFEGFALQPKEQPPVDLRKTVAVSAPREPSRVATTRPADLPDLRSDMDDLLAAAMRGDRAAVLRFAANGSERKKAVFARMCIGFARAGDTFSIRFHQTPTGPLGETMDHFSALPDEDYIVNSDGSASSRDLHMIKSSDGRWQIDIERMFPAEEDKLASLERQADLLEQWIREVETGAYPDASSALKAFDKQSRGHR